MTADYIKMKLAEVAFAKKICPKAFENKCKCACHAKEETPPTSTDNFLILNTSSLLL